MNRAEETLLGSAVCVAITIILPLKLLLGHLLHWKKPKEQKATVVIILMAPIYAIDSYLGLLQIRGSETFFEILDSIKECYEGLVMAKFLALLYTFLDISISKNTVPDENKGRVIHHSFPISFPTSQSPSEPSQTETSQVLDMTVCSDSTCVLCCDDNSSTLGDIP